MNQYTHSFLAKCPVNGKVIRYALIIHSDARIMVENILRAIDALSGAGFHEDIADTLAAALPGRHILRAHHHGVDIETIRGGS